MAGGNTRGVIGLPNKYLRPPYVALLSSKMEVLDQVNNVAGCPISKLLEMRGLVCGSRFLISGQALQRLKSEKIPDNILSKLVGKIGAQVDGRERFLDFLKDTLGEGPGRKYGPLIFRQTYGKQACFEEELVAECYELLRGNIDDIDSVKTSLECRGFLKHYVFLVFDHHGQVVKLLFFGPITINAEPGKELSELKLVLPNMMKDVTPSEIELIFQNIPSISETELQNYNMEFVGRTQKLTHQMWMDSEARGILCPDSVQKKIDGLYRKASLAITKRLSELSQDQAAIKRITESGDVIDKSTIKELEGRLDVHQGRSQLFERPVEEEVKIFISYSHKDEKYMKQLKSHLRALERIGLIGTWHDRMITAGSEWEGRIDNNLNQADVILLLISDSFVDSKYCFDVELKRALQRHENGESLVVPVIIRPVIWDDLHFAKLQVLPSSGNAVSTWSNIDLAWVNIAEGLKKAIQDFLARKKP